ncbi:MAG: class I SAM-dependent DNA methyltransferase [Rhodothermaceae bacterium]|nr:class I SAM-dependent DNA methyltransferase [Rhodothermaceae bacterium]
MSEYRARAAKFAQDWKGVTRESSEKQTFWNEFFRIFDLTRRDVATFEEFESVRHGFIDLFWPGKLIVEHKSLGKSLDDAIIQAGGYMREIKLPKHKPRYMLACDFANFHLIDLDERKKHAFTLEELPNNIALFNFMVDKPTYQEDMDPVNQKAATIMGKIYDGLIRNNYPLQDSGKMLTRLAFCMFADDVGIFEHGTFRRLFGKYDVISTGEAIAQMFEVLNTPEKNRQYTLREELAAFPYIDGDLFAERITPVVMDMELRNLILEADGYEWSKVNPAIFGGMFQSVMDADERRHMGAHYTTEQNILKVINPLFMDELWRTFEDITSEKVNQHARLEEFQEYLASLTFFDPACGSGNFLSISYRELRRLELKVIELLHDKKIQKINIEGLSKVDVHQFYGIEIMPFSTQIAKVSLWMTDHLMNRQLGGLYGQSYTRIPLERSPNIRCTDALEIDWNDVLSSTKCNYILGNPPYGGSKVQSAQQREQVRQIASLGKSGGTLDYVTAWCIKAALYTEDGHHTRIGFVATNSITQGEQVGQLWPILYKHGLDIEFAYKSFKWGSEAPGMAHVHVVIIGLMRHAGRRRLFHADVEDNPPKISPYLLGSNNVSVVKESPRPLNGLSAMVMGSKPIDGGHYIFTDEERDKFLQMEPGVEPYMRPYIGAREYINGGRRWILALHSIEPNILRALPQTTKRVNAVKQLRSSSKSLSTRKLADTPTLYHLNVLPDKPFLIIPSTSSERRKYVPIGYLEPPAIPSNATMVIQDVSLGLFGLLTSKMHMVWLNYVGGRLKSDYRYSAGMVYNTFPVPDSPLDTLEPYAQAVLDARAAHPKSTLVDLYDPDTMPPDLFKAHRTLDKHVDRLYRKEPFVSDDERMEFLLMRYENMIHAS